MLSSRWRGLRATSEDGLRGAPEGAGHLARHGLLLLLDEPVEALLVLPHVLLFLEVLTLRLESLLL